MAVVRVASEMGGPGIGARRRCARAGVAQAASSRAASGRHGKGSKRHGHSPLGPRPRAPMAARICPCKLAPARADGIVRASSGLGPKRLGVFMFRIFRALARARRCCFLRRRAAHRRDPPARVRRARGRARHRALARRAARSPSSARAQASPPSLYTVEVGSEAEPRLALSADGKPRAAERLRLGFRPRLICTDLHGRRRPSCRASRSARPGWSRSMPTAATSSCSAGAAAADDLYVGARRRRGDRLAAGRRTARC